MIVDEARLATTEAVMAAAEAAAAALEAEKAAWWQARKKDRSDRAAAVAAFKAQKGTPKTLPELVQRFMALEALVLEELGGGDD